MGLPRRRVAVHEVGINDDGSLWNPRRHDPDLVRVAVGAADARNHELRSQAALKAAQTRKRRREQKIWQMPGGSSPEPTSVIGRLA